MSDPHNLHFHEMSETAAINNYIVEAQRRTAHLTSKQAATIGEAMFRSFGAPFGGHVNVACFEQLERDQPHLWRRAPTHLQTLEWRCAQLGQVTPQQRISAWRNIERLSTDELLALVPADAQLSATPTPLKQVVKVPTLTEAQRASGWTAEDAILFQRGVDVDALSAAKRQELRRMIAKEMAPESVAAINEIRAHIAAGKTFSQIDPIVRRTAHDEAKRVGKSLSDFDVDVES